jgi:hypothetical protein
MVGAATLRDLTVECVPRYVSPDVDSIEMSENKQYLYYGGETISREVEVLRPIPGVLDNLKFQKETIPFMDGIIDLCKVEHAILGDSTKLSGLKCQGISDQDINTVSLVLPALMWKFYSERINTKSLIDSAEANKNFVAPIWDFNEIG